MVDYPAHSRTCLVVSNDSTRQSSRKHRTIVERDTRRIFLEELERLIQQIVS